MQNQDFVIMKKLYLSLLISISFAFSSQAQKFEWLYANTTNQSLGYNNPKVKTDPWGNTFIMGRYNGWMVNGTDSMLSFGGGSASFFLTKLDPAGNWLWSKTFSPHNSSIYDMCIDGNGYVYATIYCNGFITYDDGDTSFVFPNIVTLNKIVSFDNNGKVRWGIEHPEGGSQASLASSPAMQGFFTAGGNEICKIDTSGNVVWSKSVSGSFQFNGLEYNGQSTLAASGYGSAGTKTLDTVSFTLNTTTADVAVFRMDTSGSALWAQVLPNLINGSNYNLQNEMLVTASSEIYVMYRKPNGVLNYVFANDTIFNPYCPTCICGAVLKLSPSGMPLWARGVYGDSHLNAVDFILNGNEDIIFLGEAASVTYFGNYVFNNNYGLGSHQTFFTAKLLSNGNYSWFKSDSRIIGQLVYDMPYGISNGLNNTYTVMGIRQIGLAPAFQLGCLSDSNPNQGFFAVNISEGTEPVPVVNFEVIQSANKIVAFNNTQNATSISWNFGDGSPASSVQQPYHEYAYPGVYDLCLSASNNCGTATDCRQIIVKGIREIRANRGSNDGVITTEIFGGGFTPVTTARLLKHSGGSVVPIALQFVNAGKLIARFNLNGEPVTLCDLEVDVPGDTLMVKNDAFSIVAGVPYQLDVAIMGQQAGRITSWLKQTITIKNNSPKDAVGVPVFFRYRDDNSLHFVYQSFENITAIPFTNAGHQYLQANGLNTSLADYFITSSTNSSAFGGFVIPLLKAGETYTKTVFVKSTIGQQMGFGAYLFNPMVSNLSLIGSVNQETDFCLSSYFKRAIESTFSVTISDANWNNCFPAMQDSIFYSIASKAVNLQPTPAISWNAFLTAALTSIIANNCIAGLPASLTNAQLESVLSRTISNMTFYDDIQNGFSCPLLNQYKYAFDDPAVMSGNEFCDLLSGIHIPFSSVSNGAVQCLLFGNSIDPNAKYGEGNNNTDIYIKPGELLPYTITFENLSTASSPASEVIITDTLDLSKLDISTFEFGPIFIADTLLISFAEPGWAQIEFTDIPNSNNQIRTLASVDTATGVVKWIFSTVNKSDKQPNTNPFEGFLPPNVNGSEGTGICSYIINAKSTLVTGDQIDNDAEIVFDNNAPIVTNVWTNVVDNTPPQSAVNPLPPNISTSQFNISWGGSDFIAGISGYKIYVSENDGPYQLLQPFTGNTSLIFSGVNGNKYEFFSIAIDRAGNIEDAPFDPANNPDAVTTVVVGIEENLQNGMLTVFPNPVKDELTIYGKDLSGNLIVTDALGRTVFDKEIKDAVSSFRINATLLSKGFYMIELRSTKGRVTARFLKF